MRVCITAANIVLPWIGQSIAYSQKPHPAWDSQCGQLHNNHSVGSSACLLARDKINKHYADQIITTTLNKLLTRYILFNQVDIYTLMCDCFYLVQRM